MIIQNDISCYISVREVTVERIAVDSASGNIYYTALRHGSFANPGVIGVITPNGDHLTLKDDLSHPVDLVLHGEQG